MTTTGFSLKTTTVGETFVLTPASDKPIGTTACSTCFSGSTCDHGKKLLTQQNESIEKTMSKQDEDNKVAVAASVHMAEGLTVPFRLVEYPVPGDKTGAKNRVLQYRLSVNDKHFWVDVPVIGFQEATS